MAPSSQKAAEAQKKPQVEQQPLLYVSGSADTQESDICSTAKCLLQLSFDEMESSDDPLQLQVSSGNQTPPKGKDEASLSEKLACLRFQTLALQQAVYNAETEIDKWEAIRAYERHHEKCLQVQKALVVEHANKTMKDQRVAYTKEKEEWKAGYAERHAKHVAKEAELQTQLANAEAEKMQLESKVKDLVCQLECQRQQAEIEIAVAHNLGENLALKDLALKAYEERERGNYEQLADLSMAFDNLRNQSASMAEG